MSIYRGRTAGLMYGEHLRQQEEANQLQQDRIDAGLKQAAMAEQGRIAEAQIAGLNPEVRELPQKAGLPMKPPAGKTGQGADDQDALASYIQGVAMGNPSEAEKGFGMARPGSSRRNEDGSISFISTEGHPVTIPREHVDYFSSGLKPSKSKEPMDELTRREKEAGIRFKEKQTEKFGEKPINEKERFQLEQARKDMESNIRKADNAVIIAQKKLDAIKEAGTPLIFGKADAKKALLDAEMALETAKLDAEEAHKRYGDPTARVGLPTTPPQPAPVAAQPTGSGSITMGNRTMSVSSGKISDPIHDQYNLIDSALKSGKHPKTGQPLTPTEQMLAKTKLGELKKQILGR